MFDKNLINADLFSKLELINKGLVFLQNLK